jgi:hypothetical protein
MSSHWATVHELVIDLGSVCLAFNEAESLLGDPEPPELAEAVRAKLDAATAVSRVARQDVEAEDIEATVTEARAAIVRARETITRIQAELLHSQKVRARAHSLVERSRTLQREREHPGHEGA